MPHPEGSDGSILPQLTPIVSEVVALSSLVPLGHFPQLYCLIWKKRRELTKNLKLQFHSLVERTWKKSNMRTENYQTKLIAN